MTRGRATEIVAMNLRSLMARDRRRQVDLAAVLGMSQAAVSRRLSGETPLDVDELMAVAEWLEVPIERLVRDEESLSSASGGQHARRPATGTIRRYPGDTRRANRVSERYATAA